MRLVLLLWLFCHPAFGWSQQPPKAPQTPTKQQSDRTLKEQEYGSSKASSPAIPLSTIPAIGTPSTDEKSQGNAQQGHYEASEFWTISGHRVKITDTLLVVFTFLLAVATFFLWLATRRLVKGAEKTAESQLRAYVFVESVKIRNPYSYEAKTLTIVIKNYGQTPAYDLNISLGTKVAPGDSKPEFRPEPAERRGSLAPSATTELYMTLPPFTADDRSELIQGFKLRYAFGKICYTDAFQKRRFTDFRYRHGGGFGSGAGNLAIDPEDNDAD